MRKLKLFMLAGAAATACAAQAQAAGFYLQEQSVRGAGRAYSGEVADQGVESLWWNAASIARSGREGYVGVHGIFVEGNLANKGSSVTYPGGVTVPVSGFQNTGKPILPGLAPNLAVAMPVGDRFAVGLSVAAPFNFSTKYSTAHWTRYDALTSQLRNTDIQLTGAMRATDWLDLGVSLDAQYMKAHLSNAYPNLSPLLPTGFSELSGDGWDYGWSVGAQGHFEKLTVGASYRAKIDHELTGSVRVSGILPPLPAALNINGAATASVTTPWMAILGMRYAVNDQLTLNAQVQRTGWSEFDAIRITTPLGPQVQPQDYKDTTSGAVGLDYIVNPALTLRGGVQYDPTPTPDVGRTPRVPDGNRWLVGVGATGNVSPALKVEAALSYIHFKDALVNHTTTFYGGTPAATTTRMVGQMKGQGFVMSLGIRSGF